ncbi:DUF6541 family protein [Propionimicrobium lymphophilum]|uniref:DUF6541 family protein n=1 Tax=Propionimicrobium lymphophilum TaxID=33012 RepID=UPI00041E64D5|nr:DUF6541 family protein [Propionimicrobium lymphophilum]
MDWLGLLPVILVGLAMLYLPGFAILVLARQPLLRSLAIAPLVTAFLHVSTGLVFGFFNIPWTWRVPSGLSLIISVLVAVIYRKIPCKINFRPPRTNLTIVLVFLAGVSLLAMRYVRIVRHPSNIAQTYDNVFHLNAVRFIVDTKNGSPLHVFYVTGANGKQFYPNGFHDIVSGVLEIFPSSLGESFNAVVLILFAFTWLISCFYLVETVFGMKLVNVIAAAVLVPAFNSMPVTLLDWVLYPLFAAYVFLPVLLALGLQLFDVGVNKKQPFSETFVLLCFAGAGACLIHPTGAFAFFLMMIPVTIIWVARKCRYKASGEISKKEFRFSVGVFFLIWVMIFACWALIRPMRESAIWEPSQTFDMAFGSALLNEGIRHGALYVVSFFSVSGLIICIWRRKRIWLLMIWGIVVLAWGIVSSSAISWLRWAVTGPWYMDPYRILPLISVPALLLAVIGFKLVLKSLVQRAELKRTDVRVIAILFVLFSLILSQVEPGIRHSDEKTAENYQMGSTGDDGSPMLLDKNEMKIFDIAEYRLPDDAVLGTVPNNGSSMIYAYKGIKTINTHLLYEPTDDVRILEEHLDEIGHNPKVCEAAKRLGVEYVLDFGDRYVGENDKSYAGFNNFKNNSSFDLLAVSGKAAIYKIVGCGTSQQ